MNSARINTPNKSCVTFKKTRNLKLSFLEYTRDINNIFSAPNNSKFSKTSSVLFDEIELVLELGFYNKKTDCACTHVADFTHNEMATHLGLWG